MRDRIEILPVSLLETEKSTVDELKALAEELNLEFGWHYLLDLSWILRYLDRINGQKMIDAGAGTGVMQWYLAKKGASVISIDRESRADLAPRFRRRFEVEGLREDDLLDGGGLTNGFSQSSLKSRMADFVDAVKYETKTLTLNEGQIEAGKVIIYNQDLADLADIPDISIDAIVAVSSLEHNSLEGLLRAVAELLRVIKPGGVLLATLGAAQDEDWYHGPSQGWCYSEGTLRRIFDISSDVQSNYDQYDRLFDSLKKNNDLKDNLASFYFRSGDNGMPWGEWDPKYQPVGIAKVKAEK
jgi:ubiquinone/menaquinone biosynthesis C-methylase UbiE